MKRSITPEKVPVAEKYIKALKMVLSISLTGLPGRLHILLGAWMKNLFEEDASLEQPT